MWLYNFLNYVFLFYEFALIVYILSSWLPMLKNTFIVRFLEDICEPYLKIFRKILPPVAMVDFSPIVALITLGFIKRIVFSLAFGMPIM